MKKIYKYPLVITDRQPLELPEEAEILTVQSQNDVLCIWAIVDTEQVKKRTLNVYIAGTEHDLPEEIAGPGAETVYLGTAQTRGGALMWHVFYDIIFEPDA